MLLSPFIPLSPSPTVSTNPFSISELPFLPCRFWDFVDLLCHLVQYAGSRLATLDKPPTLSDPHLSHLLFLSAMQHVGSVSPPRD